MLIIRMRPFPILGVLGGVFHVFPNFNRPFCINSKQTVKIPIRHCIFNQTYRYAVSDLGLHYLPMSHKKDARTQNNLCFPFKHGDLC